MAIPWNEDIPKAADEPSASQPQLLANNQFLPVWLAIDHYPFVANDAGKHKQVTMPELAVAPTTLGNEGALYTKQGALSAVAELFFRRESNGVEINMTGSSGGYTFLPSGLLVKFGSGAQNTTPGTFGFNKVFPFPGGAPAFSAVYIVYVTTAAGNDAANADRIVQYVQGSLTATQFNTNSFVQSTFAPLGGIAFNWLAIGLP